MSNNVSISTSGLSILFCALGYFVYGGFDGVFAVAILTIVGSFISLISLIPILGIVIDYFAWKWLATKVLLLTGLKWTWLISIMFGLHLLGSVIITIAICIFIIATICS